MGRRFLVLCVLLAVAAGALPAQAQFITNVERLNPDGNSGDTPVVVSDVPLGENVPTFADREHAYVTVPEPLLGVEYILTANDDKDNPNHELHFTITADGNLYLFLDNRIGGNSSNTRDQLPNLGAAASLAWVTDMGFTDTGMKIAIDEATDGDIDQWFSVYSLKVGPGDYVLGAQNDGGSRNMYGVAFGAPRLKAYKPDPADGATGVTLPLFTWTKGDTAVLHSLYLGTSPELTEADIVLSRMPIMIYYHGPGLVPGTTYYWRVDEIEADVTTVHVGDVWSLTAAPLTAFEPQPRDGAKWVDPDVDLSWTPGDGALSHDVYFGTDEAAVAAGAAEVAQGNQLLTTFDPGTLEPETTYYWRVDEVLASGTTKHTGDLWRFTTLGPGGGVKGEYFIGMIPSGIPAVTRIDPVIDFSWPDGTTQGTNSPDAAIPTNQFSCRWTGELQVAFTDTYTLITRSDDGVRLYLDGRLLIDNWTNHSATDDFTEPLELVEGQVYSLMMEMYEDGGGAVAQLSWQSPSLPREVIPAGPLALPLRASAPYPANAAVDVPQTAMLSWSAGDKAAGHEVYFGEDAEAVAAGDPSSAVYMGPQSDPMFDPGALDWGKTYYWRVDEVDDTDPDSPWRGAVWSFTTADFIVVDDFESYTDNMDAGEAIWQTWLDGLTNLTGSIVGYFDAINGTFGETTIVHGGRQSMPLDYNNVIAPYYSEAELPFSSVQDWTINDVTDLAIWFRGSAIAFAETAANAFTMSAAGTDIAGTSDEFTYTYKMLNGNGTIVAKVDSVDNTNAWAKAAVMIRQNLDPSSKFAMVCATPGNGVRFQARLLPGDSHMSDTPVATPEQIALRAPVWIKLERTGDQFNGFYSTDGNAWTAMVWNPQTIVMIGNVYIGLALTSHSAGNVCTAEFSEVAATGNVTGQWTFVEVGTDHPLNGLAGLYVAVQDSTNRVGVVRHPDPAAVGIDAWTEWRIPMSELGVNAAKIKTLFIGLGDRDNPTPGGAGRLYIDDIRVMKPAPAPEE